MGHIPYGSSIRAEVILAEPIDACIPLKNNV